MAVITPFITKNQVLGAKIETTTGTAIALSATDGAFNVEDFTFDEDIPENKREGQGPLSRPASVPGARAARIKFKLPIYGKGASGVPDWMSTFLPACGLVASAGVYSPITPGTVTLTMGMYEGGLIRKIVGAMGNVGFSATAGNPVIADFDFLGALEVEADATQITPTFPTIIPPRWAGTTNTIGGTSYYWSKFELTSGNVLKLREDAGPISAYLACAIVGRDGQLTVDPEMTLVATKNWQSELFASTQSAFSIIAGTATNNKFTFAGPKAQPVIKARGDRGGLKTNELTFRLGRGTAPAYDDEWSIAAG